MNQRIVAVIMISILFSGCTKETDCEKTTSVSEGGCFSHSPYTCQQTANCFKTKTDCEASGACDKPDKKIL